MSLRTRAVESVQNILPETEASDRILYMYCLLFEGILFAKQDRSE